MASTIVFGASGQLGQCLSHLAEERKNSSLIFIPEEKANILDLGVLKAIFEEYKPTYCINCAAYTAVDKAEDETELARHVNRDGAENLAKLCLEYSTVLIHISTDFVFAGTGNEPLIEECEPSPVNIYGITKLEGEFAIQSILERYFILRTSWLYSEFGNNFLKTILRLSNEREELRVIWDQVGTPTYAVDLAKCILHLVETKSEAYGLYHYSNEGVTSWYDFAKAILELSKKSTRLISVRTAEYISKAKRPMYTVMDKAKIKKELGLYIPYWRDSLQECLQNI